MVVCAATSMFFRGNFYWIAWLYASFSIAWFFVSFLFSSSFPIISHHVPSLPIFFQHYSSFFQHFPAAFFCFLFLLTPVYSFVAEIVEGLYPAGSDVRRPDGIQEAIVGALVHHSAAADHDMAVDAADLLIPGDAVIGRSACHFLTVWMKNSICHKVYAGRIFGTTQQVFLLFPAFFSL